MDIKSPRLLKIKGILFFVLGLISSILLLSDRFDLRSALLLTITIWAFCRFYYFAFYVLHHYADPGFKYAGLWSLIRYLWTGRIG